MVLSSLAFAFAYSKHSNACFKNLDKTKYNSQYKDK
ncbi:hypothetical protein ACMC3T_001585 [Campylobacter coli]